MRNLFICCLFFFAKCTFAQTIQLLPTSVKASFRGLSVVDDNVIWVSGSGGTIGRSVNGGETWNFQQLPGFEKIEFRDIEGFDALQAVAMGIGSPAYILRTTDGGEHWDIVFKDTTPGMFLDAMEFWNRESGILLGDPIEGRFYIARTFDGGKSWRGIPTENRPLADSGEACFASSGCNIIKNTKAEAVFVSGGYRTHFFHRNQKIELPMPNGKESTGANAIAAKNKKALLAVGGDFSNKDERNGTAAWSDDGGMTWNVPQINPLGYRSGVCFWKNNNWIVCGLNGVDLTEDNGKTFRSISTTGFHVCKKAKKGKSVFMAGGQGRIGKLVEK
jgi:photosystem II stability/assembly factor-like uncharacterized protein